MGHDLKLNIYRFSIKPSGKKIDGDGYLFKTFFESKFTPKEGLFTKQEAYTRFVESFIKSFNGEFKENKKKTKAFRANEGDLKFDSGSNIIYGMLHGGNTNMKIDVYKKSGDFAKGITNQEVSTLKFFFMIWAPFDKKDGIIFIQSYQGVPHISDCFFEHLRVFFKSFYKHSISRVNHVPNKIKQEFYEKSRVVSIAVYTQKKPKAGEEVKPTQFSEENVSMKIEFSGFSIKPENILDYFKTDKKIYGIDFDSLPDDLLKKAYFVDQYGRKSHSILGTKEGLTPVILLPDELKIPGEQTVDFDATLAYISELLETIKVEDGYTIMI